MYEIYGPLFFGSVVGFLEKFDVENDPDNAVIDFKESRIADMSAIDALNKITAKYSALNKRVVLKHLNRTAAASWKRLRGSLWSRWRKTLRIKVVADR